MMPRCTVVTSLLCYLVVVQEIRTSGDRPIMTSAPDKPTSVAIGQNVSLAWRFYVPTHLKVQEITFGIWNPGYIRKKLVAVNSLGSSNVRRGFENKVIWAGNVTSSAVFILHNVRPPDGREEFGVHIEFGLHHQPLTDSVRLLVKDEVSSNPAKITHVSFPGLLNIGDTVILDCAASGLTPVQVKWYKDGEVQANGISRATFTLHNITSNDWGTCICVARNTDGRDEKIVLLKVRPESPTILNRNTTVPHPSWTLRWSTVRSEGMSVTLYTVWRRVLHVIDGNITWRESWQRQNITGVKYHTELVADTWYNFGVTAWNKWGDSLLSNDGIITVVANFSELDEKATAFLQTEKPVISRSSQGSRTEPHVAYDVYVFGGGGAAVFVFVIVFLVKYIKWRKADDRRKRFSKGEQEIEGSSRMPSNCSEQPDNESSCIATQRRGSMSPSDQDVSLQSVEFSLDQSGSSRINVLEANDQRETPIFLPGPRPRQMGICQKKTRKHLKTFVPHSRSEKSQNQEIYEAAHMNASPVFPAQKGKTRDLKRTVYEGTTVETLQKYKSTNENYEEVNEENQTPSRSCREKSGTQTEELLTKHTAEEKDRVLACAFHQDVTDPEGYLRPSDENISYCENKDVRSATLPFLPRKKSRENILEEGNYSAKSIWKHFTLGNKPSASKPRLREQPTKTVNQRRRRFKHVTQSEGRDPNTGNPTSQCIHSYQNDNFRTGKRCPRKTNLLSSQVNSSKQQRLLEREPHYTCVRENTNWEIPLERLTLFNKIGGGAFGEVWTGVARDVGDTHGWSMVAIKMLKENSSKADLRDLLSELNMLKKLESHPNVIRFLGCVTKDRVLCQEKRLGPPLVILEFVPYGDLLGYLIKSMGGRDNYYNLKEAEISKRIETRQLYSFALDIACGMGFIASKQLIHRDLAARNVLVGEGLRCKITDFGMARDLGKSDMYIRRSNGLMPIKWMACESLTSQVFTIESDVWSYGVVLYEIFTLGKKPYEGMSGEEVMHFITSGRRLPRISTISPELYNVMLQCWEKEPAERPTFSHLASIMEKLQTQAMPQVSSSQHK